MRSRCSVASAVLRGVEAVAVEVEVAISDGIPSFGIVGMADAAVQESRERVRAALKATGYTMPASRIVVNLAPSSLRKTGSGFDLAIAVALLCATKQIDPQISHDALFVGELSLDGRVRPVAGLLAYALCARSLGFSFVCACAPECLVEIAGLDQRGLRSLSDLKRGEFVELAFSERTGSTATLDYADVAGHEVAKRAIQIAAAGEHGLLMVGPPGSGKTMLASRISSVLPDLTYEEMLETALVHSVASEDIESILNGTRPYRAPHHSSSVAGLVGGGSPIRPGEISLAHNGVLFLDELAEFKPSVLQSMRQPMEQGMVNVTRADGVVTFPAKFMLVAASNPCPCGYYGDKEIDCTCSSAQIHAYQNRIGGPLMDRIDMHIDVARIPPGDVLEQQTGTDSATLKEGVLKAREYASWRKAKSRHDSSVKSLVESCQLSKQDQEFFEQAAIMNHMSGRGIVRTLSVARTIADIAQRARVESDDLFEALSFRIREEVR